MGQNCSEYKYLQYHTWYSHLHKIQLWYALLSKHWHNTDNAYFLMLLIFCPTGTILHSILHVDKMFNGKIEINDIQKQDEQQPAVCRDCDRCSSHRNSAVKRLLLKCSGHTPERNFQKGKNKNKNRKPQKTWNEKHRVLFYYPLSRKKKRPYWIL